MLCIFWKLPGQGNLGNKNLNHKIGLKRLLVHLCQLVTRVMIDFFHFSTAAISQFHVIWQVLGLLCLWRCLLSLSPFTDSTSCKCLFIELIIFIQTTEEFTESSQLVTHFDTCWYFFHTRLIILIHLAATHILDLDKPSPDFVMCARVILGLFIPLTGNILPKKPLLC